MENNLNTAVHVVVDMLYDFIDGSLACKNSVEAVKKSVAYINRNPGQKVVYVCDSHPANHCSFTENGGEWPPHCVEGTRGKMIHNLYFQKVNGSGAVPFGDNVFLKGCPANEEQYSGFEAVNSEELTVGEFINIFFEGKETEKNVVVSGIATEYCIKESVLDLMKAGFKVFLLKDALGYVSREGHEETLKSLENAGVILI